jgi:hypothetical protein
MSMRQFLIWTDFFVTFSVEAYCGKQRYVDHVILSDSFYCDDLGNLNELFLLRFSVIK